MPYQVTMLNQAGAEQATLVFDDLGNLIGQFPEPREDVQRYYAYEVSGPGSRLITRTKHGLQHLRDKGKSAIILGVGPTHRGLESAGFEWGETEDGAAWFSEDRSSIEKMKQAGMPFIVQ